MEAFLLAAELGATGLETDAWLTRDGVVVLDHDGAVKRGRGWRRTSIRDVDRSELPTHVPEFTDLLRPLGTSVEISVDLKADGVGEAIIELIEEYAPGRIGHVWLCHPDLDRLVDLRRRSSAIKLVHSTRFDNLGVSAEQWARRLSEAGIDAMNMRQPDWSPGRVSQFHRFQLAAFMWDVQHEHELIEAFRIGIDGVFSDHVRRMVSARDSIVEN